MPTRVLKLRSYAPDADPTADGVVTESQWVFPTVKGYRSLPGLAFYAPPLPSACLGAFIGRPGNSAPVIVAGTIDDLYMLVSGAWVAQGLTVTGVSPRWRFAVYGNDIITVNGADAPFVSTSGGTFAPLSGSPPVSSSVCATDFSLFLVLSGTFTWISSLSDTIWTVAISTETVQGDITSTSGPIIGAKALRGGIAFYKEHALYYATFTGPPLFWDVNKVSAEVGAPCEECVVIAQDAHWFWAGDNFYRFDGFNLQPLPNRLREFFSRDLDASNKALMIGRWDESRSLAFWHYPSVGSGGIIDSYMCLNVQTGEWAHGRLPLEFAINGRIPSTLGMTYAEFEAMFVTYSPNLPYNWPGFGSSQPELSGIIGLDHALYVFSGPPPTDDLAPSITSGEFGNRRTMFDVRRLRPGFAIDPGFGNAAVEVQGNFIAGDPLIPRQTVPLSWDGSYNVHNTDRMQRFKQNFLAEVEVIELSVESEDAGEV